MKLTICPSEMTKGHLGLVGLEFRRDAWAGDIYQDIVFKKGRGAGECQIPWWPSG